MTRPEARIPPLSLPSAWLLLALSLAFARPCAADGAMRVAPDTTVVRPPIEAYAPSPLALRTPAPRDDGHPAPGEDAWSVGPRGTQESRARFMEYASTGATLGTMTGVIVMMNRTRGDDGFADLFEPFLWAYGGAVGAVAGWAVGGALALATQGH